MVKDAYAEVWTVNSSFGRGMGRGTRICFVLYHRNGIGSVRRYIGPVWEDEARSKVNVMGRGKGQCVRVVSAPNRGLGTRAPCCEPVLSAKAGAKCPYRSIPK